MAGFGRGGCRGALAPRPARSGRPERTGGERQPRGLTALDVTKWSHQGQPLNFLFRSPSTQCECAAWLCDLLLVSHLTAASFRRPPGLGLGGLRPQSTVRFRLSPSSFAEPAPLHPRFFQNRQPTPSTSRIPTPSTFVFNCVSYLCILPLALRSVFFLHSGPWIAPLFAPCLPSPPTKALTTRHPPRHP